jgi:hypothetical protein
MNRELDNLIDGIIHWFRSQGWKGSIITVLLFAAAFATYFCIPLAPVH